MRKVYALMMGCLVLGLLAAPAVAQQSGDYSDQYMMQDSEEMTETTTMVVSSSERYIRSPLFFDDATPQPTGTADLRFKLNYLTENNPLPTDDHKGAAFQWLWGFAEDWEVSFELPVNVGDGWNNADGGDGNWDSYVGLHYRLWEEGTFSDWMPAFALSGRVRIPTGYHSNGVDGELRGHLTKTLAGSMRGHLNAFAITVNGDNDPGARDFQWGFVAGIDTPLTAAEDWWLMLDYLHRSSEHYGVSNMNMFEAGLEYKMSDISSLHLTTQVGLDDNDDTPNFGARIAYTHELQYN